MWLPLVFVLSFIGTGMAAVCAVLLVLFQRAPPKVGKSAGAARAAANDFAPPSAAFIGNISDEVVERMAPDAAHAEAVGRVVLSRMGIDPTTYTVDAEVPRLGTWAGLLLGFGQHRADARWTMHYLSLMPSSVLLVFGDRSSLVGCVHLDRCRVEVPEHHSDELHGMGVLKLTTLDGMPVCTYSSAMTVYILFSSAALQKTWLSALQTATVESMHAVDRAFSRMPPAAAGTSVAATAASASIPSLVAPKADPGAQSLLWLNLFLERYFADMMQSQTYYYRTMKMLSEKLLLIRKPSWIGSVSLKELNIGNAAINIGSIAFHAGASPREMIGHADLVYKGGLRISYGAILVLGKSLRVPVEVLVHLESLAGRITIFAPCVLHEKWSAYFVEMPDVSVTVKVIVGGQDKRMEVTSLKNLHKFAQKTFLKQVELALVFPSRLRFYLPIRGRKAWLRNQRFNAELGGYQYPIPPQVVATLRAQHAVDARKDIVSTWAERGTLKADLREFVVLRLFEVCLNHGYLKLLPQLLANDVRMTGGSPQVECLGMEQVYAHFRQLWNAFEDFECVVLRFSFDRSGNAVCRWRISGVHVKALWDQSPTDKRVALHGITQVTFEAGQFRLQRLRNYYRLPLLALREKEAKESDEQKPDDSSALSRRKVGSIKVNKT